MSKQNRQSPQPVSQKSPQKIDLQIAKAHAQSKIAKPDKNVIVPKYVCFANERLGR
jgi:hypothetical protein